jgi:hypothetical protein
MDANDILRVHGPAGLREAFDAAPTLPNGHDHGGSADAEARPVSPVVGSAAPRKLFRPVQIDDVTVTQSAAWLIHRVVPARGLFVIVGPPKSRKSFFASDVFFCVARGALYGGRATKQGPVFYLTGEGVTGFKRRCIALRRHNGVEGRGVPFFVIDQVPDLGSKATDVDQLLAQLDAFILERALPKPAAIVLDTLARCMGEGDENATADMGRFVQRCGVIEAHFECLVAVVHHTGKDPSKGSRGSNSLNGAADVTVTITKNDAYSTARIDEMKDGPEGQEWRFRLVPYDISETSGDASETENETSTCVVELLSQPTQAKPKTKPQPSSVKGVKGDLLNIIRKAIDEAGEPNSDCSDAPRSAKLITRKMLKSYCETMDWQDPINNADGFRSMMSKTLSSLRTDALIGFDKRYVWSAEA